jgi:site-specific DNA-adenine methylase
LWTGTSAFRIYCEPFFGSGAIGWQMLNQLPPSVQYFIINDADHGIAAQWRAVRDTAKELM